MDTFFSVLGFILFLQSLLALGAVIRFARYALRRQPARQNRYQPKAVVIVPCKGLEPDFEENIRALFVQEYREYEIIFVTESEIDPAHAVLNKLIQNHSRRPAWLIVAGEARARGQKVHNLCAAIDMLNAIDRRAEVLVFADSDARPAKTWLAELIAPLGDKRIGATTGFRWYVPERNKFSALLLSVWNASALALMGERSGFAWGGATALRRENFDKLNIKRAWQHALSDDYALTAAIHGAGQRIKFIPACLVASHTAATSSELLEFSTRQMRITRVYAPRVWQLAGFSHGLFNLAFWGGWLWLLASAWRGDFSFGLATWLSGTLLFGAVTGWLRATVAAHLLPANRARINQLRWSYALCGPLVSGLYLYNVVAAALSRRIVWRGIGYEMVSPQETVIWHRPAHQAGDKSPRSARPPRASVRSSSQKR
jgi:ceramide glucosyltransferase